MFERIKLPYSFDALEPHIDAATMEIHYEKHHKAYTDNFNKLVEKVPMFQNMDARTILMNLDKAPEDLREGLRNQGGGYYNHNLFFESMTPEETEPTDRLLSMIKAKWENTDAMLLEMHETATGKLFGSGWAWLVLENGGLKIVISHNQDSPLQQCNPNLLLPLDMWEHAYYLKYRNDKKSYVKEFFKVVNWDKVSERMEQALENGFSG